MIARLALPPRLAIAALLAPPSTRTAGAAAPLDLIPPPAGNPLGN